MTMVRSMVFPFALAGCATLMAPAGGPAVSPKRVNSRLSPILPARSRQDVKLARPVDGEGAAGDAELGVEAGGVRLHRVGRQTEDLGDLLVGAARAQRVQHLHLLRSEEHTSELQSH